MRYDSAQMADVRRAAVSGSWYPGTKVQLALAIEQHLAAAAPSRVPACPRALVAPHAGLVYSGPVAAHAYKLVRHCDYSAVVLVGPSHFVGFHGVSIWPRGVWDTPLGPVAVDEGLAAAIQHRLHHLAHKDRMHRRIADVAAQVNLDGDGVILDALAHLERLQDEVELGRQGFVGV